MRAAGSWATYALAITLRVAPSCVLPAQKIANKFKVQQGVPTASDFSLGKWSRLLLQFAMLLPATMRQGDQKHNGPAPEAMPGSRKRRFPRALLQSDTRWLPCMLQPTYWGNSQFCLTSRPRHTCDLHHESIQELPLCTANLRPAMFFLTPLPNLKATAAIPH